jgi:hypothetical protein
MADRFEHLMSGLNSPASDGFAVVPHDSTNFSTAARSIYVGGEGDVVLETVGGTVLTFKAVPAGAVIPMRTRRVNATGTSATFMLGLF